MYLFSLMGQKFLLFGSEGEAEVTGDGVEEEGGQVAGREANREREIEGGEMICDDTVDRIRIIYM